MLVSISRAMAEFSGRCTQCVKRVEEMRHLLRPAQCCRLCRGDEIHDREVRGRPQKRAPKLYPPRVEVERVCAISATDVHEFCANVHYPLFGCGLTAAPSPASSPASAVRSRQKVANRQ